MRPSGSTATLDIAVADGRIAAVAPHIDGSGLREIACTGRIVTPGLVDVHVHCFEGMLKGIGMSVYDATLRRGVVACNDAGTSGASNFAGFRRFTVDDAVNAARANPSIIRGFKVRLSRNVVTQPVRALSLARGIAETAGLPLMVHIGVTEIGLEQILERLAPGDIVTHSFTGLAGGLVHDGSIIPAAWEARERGVLFDIGHGRAQFDHGVARTVIEGGFPPDLLGSDLSVSNQYGPAYDLPTVMAKMVTLGMPLESAVRATTLRAAAVLGLRDEGYGAITVGEPAFVTVMGQLVHTDWLPEARRVSRRHSGERGAATPRSGRTS